MPFCQGADKFLKVIGLFLRDRSKLPFSCISCVPDIRSPVKHSETETFTWLGHVIRWKNSLANTMLQGRTNGCGKRGRHVRKDMAE